MKNVYIYLTLLLLVSIKGFGQLQNANWYFGNHHALSFLPDPFNPTILSNSSIASLEASASVSDESGVFLFYTDGQTVWNRNNQVMPNGTGLLGSQSSTQGAVIIPKPCFEGVYYIITIDGITGAHNGLHYSEVDMSLSNGLGDVVPITKNSVLKDHNQIDIDVNYLNGSEKVTTTRHSNGTEIWLVTQINNYIYSYLVNSFGISPSPVSVSEVPVNTSLINSQYNSTGVGQMKISLNGEHIAIVYNSEYTLYTGDFNNTTGNVTLDETQITNPDPEDGGSIYGLEFSHSGDFLYFAMNYLIYQSTARISARTTNVKIYRTETKNKTHNDIKEIGSLNFSNDRKENSEARASQIDLSGFYEGSLQLAINNKIYIGHRNSSHLAALNDPDSYSNPDLEEYAITFQTPVYGYNLPPWVQDKTNAFICPQNITLNTESFYEYYLYKYEHYIATNGNYIVNPGQDINLVAGDYISLENNTYINDGSLFLAKIEPCKSCGGNNNPKTPTNQDENNDIHSEYRNNLILYPNPAGQNVILTSNENLITISVISLEGKTIFNKKLSGKDVTYQLDLSNYKAGIYFVTVATANGSTTTERLIVQ